MKSYVNPHKLFVGSFIPNWLLRRNEISPGAKLGYARLCQYAGKDGVCFPKQETLAKELGCSRSQIIRYLKELKAHNLIERQRIGLHCSNRYRFLYHPWMQDVISNSGHQEVADMQHQEVAYVKHHKGRESKERESVEKFNGYHQNENSKSGRKNQPLRTSEITPEVLKNIDPKYRKYAENAAKKKE